jgi:4-hydroxy-tetrahydrodipicolinate synthase
MTARQTMPLPASGVIPPMVTPLEPGGAPDLASLDRLVDHLIETGVTGLLVLGSTGEAGMLDQASREHVLRRTVERARGRVHVMAGVPALGTRDTVTMVRRWSELEPDSLLVTAPYAFQLSPSELADHFKLVAGSTSIPVLAYNIPVRVQVVLQPAWIAELARAGVIQGVKDSSGDVQNAHTLATATSNLSEFRRYTGSEQAMDSWLLAGFDAVVPGLANPFSRFHVELTRRAAAGDWPGARRVQDGIVDLLRLYQYSIPGASFTASAVACMKEALVLQGVIAHSTVSTPFGQPDAGLRTHVKKIVDRAGELMAVASISS